MLTFADLAKVLYRSTVYLSCQQSRFELPNFDGTGYSEDYLAFLQTVVHVRKLSIKEETLRDLWHIEKKLLVLLHADTTGSPTWFLDSCGNTTCLKRASSIMSDLIHYQFSRDRVEAGDAKDFEAHKSSTHQIRWENTTRWARQHLVDDGRMKKGSPYGTWEISEKGKTWLQRP